MTAAEEPRADVLLRVVNADATPEEIAALVAVFASLTGGRPATSSARRTPEWNSPRRLMRPTPGASWRASGLPGSRG